jgi:hypothetical protein
LERGILSPWIAIEAEGRPGERYNDQVRIYSEIAQKNGITVEELRSGKHNQEVHEAYVAFDASGENEEYKVWQEKNAKLRKQIEELIHEYEKQQ